MHKHLLLLTVISAMSATARADYLYTRIADSSGQFRFVGFQSNQGPYGAPAINNNGTVTVDATLRNGATGVYTGDGGALTTIATSGGALRAVGSFDSINDLGTVAFNGAPSSTNDDEGLYTGNGGS